MFYHVLSCFCLVGGDWNMTFIFSICWECHHPNWLFDIVQRGWTHQPVVYFLGPIIKCIEIPWTSLRAWWGMTSTFSRVFKVHFRDVHENNLFQIHCLWDQNLLFNWSKVFKACFTPIFFIKESLLDPCYQILSYTWKKLKTTQKVSQNHILSYHVFWDESIFQPVGHSCPWGSWSQWPCWVLRAWCAWRAAKKPSTRTDGGRACATWEGWEAVEIAMDNGET